MHGGAIHAKFLGELRLRPAEGGAESDELSRSHDALGEVTTGSPVPDLPSAYISPRKRTLMIP